MFTDGYQKKREREREGKKHVEIVMDRKNIYYIKFSPCGNSNLYIPLSYNSLFVLRIGKKPYKYYSLIANS